MIKTDEWKSQNDELERLSSDRFSVYRRCKFEEIDLPMSKGSLDDVPIDEVSSCVQVGDE